MRQCLRKLHERASAEKSNGNLKTEALIMTTNKPKRNAVEPDDQPTAQELSVLKKHLAERDTAPRIKLLKNGNTTEISVDHPSQSVGFVLLMQALGTGGY